MSQYLNYAYHSTEQDHSHHYVLAPTLNMLGGDKDRPILDLGCGNGSFAYQLQQKGFTVFGTDASEQGIHFANQLIPDHFFVQDLSSDDLPAPLQQIPFQTVIATEVIEHLYNPKQFVQFAKRILVANGGGQLILSTPYHGYLKYLALAITGKMDNHLGPLWDGGHIKFWSRKSITQLLEEHGFKVTAFAGAGRLPYLWKSMVVCATI